MKKIEVVISNFEADGLTEFEFRVLVCKKLKEAGVPIINCGNKGPHLPVNGHLSSYHDLDRNETVYTWSPPKEVQ